MLDTSFRILFVCNEYPPSPHGGIGTFVQSLSRQLAQRECRVVVVGFDPAASLDRQETDQGVTVYRLADPFRNIPRLRMDRFALDWTVDLRRKYLSRRVNRIAKLEQVQLIESYDWSGPLGRKPDLPLVVRLHGANAVHAYHENRKPAFGLKSREFANIRMAGHCVAVSSHIGETTMAALGRSLTYEVIYNGVDCDLFSPARVETDANEVLYVGSINRRKGVYELLKAAPHILDARPQTHFKFVGNCSEVERAQIEGVLADFPPAWQKKIQFIGRVPHDQLPAFYRHAAVVVFPSLAEAFGLTCVEAMACARPVVVTSLASGPELVEDGQSGLLANPTRPEEFASSVLSLLGDASMAAGLGLAARQRALTLFNLRDLAERNLAYYRKELS